ncbi:MAG TPA: GNAT family N-acetyltransferase [Candidatus Limnocylindria bacterium]|nr:GNAT family N-acetyltransferase [Candidatus Limnocylindria bacterium]
MAEAAQLLAHRHARQRLVWPALNPAFEDQAVATELIGTHLARDGASGSMVRAGGAAVAYVLGAPKEASWGANVWVDDAGSAGSDSAAIRIAYGDAAARWRAAGLTHHYVVTPATDTTIVDAWFRLSFGLMQVHALRELPPADFAIRANGLVVRPAERRDVDALIALDPVLPSHVNRSPVFSAVAIPTPDEARQEIDQDFDDARFTPYVAERNGRVVGAATYCSLEVSNSNTVMMRPVSAGFLGYAAVAPDARGLGAGRALGDACLVWARDNGYEWVATDWRSTNLEADRTWRAAGFRPTFYRLFRQID